MAIDPHPPQLPPYGPPPSGPPPYGYGYGPAPYGRTIPTSGLAVASLVCSLAGLLTFGLLSIAGVFCGHLALPETRTGARGGHGLAIAGLIIGWVQVGGWLLFWFFVVLGIAMGA